MPKFPNRCQVLQVVRALKNKGSEENCVNCGQKRHLRRNCWGNCPECGELGHRPGECQISPDKVRAREKRKKRRRRNINNKRLNVRRSNLKSICGPNRLRNQLNFSLLIRTMLAVFVQELFSWNVNFRFTRLNTRIYMKSFK